MIIKALILGLLTILKAILTPIGAALSAVGINTLISNFIGLLDGFITLFLNDGVQLAAYFFNWPLVLPLFTLWFGILGVVKVYNIYRVIRNQLF